VLRPLLFIQIFALAIFAGAQQPAPPSTQPQVKVNMLNVCAPSPEEKQEIASALSKVPKQPLFGSDFEVARGSSSLEAQPNFLQAGANAQMGGSSDTAKWVRMRKEFSVQSLFSTVQYSFSADPKSMIETLVFRVRDPKDLLELTIEDSASTVTTPAAMLSTSTPASRIKLERFGKSSVVLARCNATEAGPAPDQSAYEPLFQHATGIVADYRHLLGARSVVPDELARITAAGSKSKAKSNAAGKAK
jgi:hypothetical protein